jgi:anti-sigma B factor antagonist
MSAELTVKNEQLREDVYVVTPAGEIDIHTAPVLERAAAKALEEATGSLLFDLTAVSFMDSTAINLLLVTRKRLDLRGAKLAVVCPNLAVARVFDMLALRELLRVGDSREQALALLQG